MTGDHDGVYLRNELHANAYFEGFVASILNLLTNDFPDNLLKFYMRIVYRSLIKLEYYYAKKLAYEFRELGAKDDDDDIREEILGYMDELNIRRLHMAEFLTAMEAAFTKEHGDQFRDYIEDVRDYGKLLTNDDDILEKTNSLLGMILDAVTKLSKQDQTQLKRLIKKAVKEFNSNT